MLRSVIATGSIRASSDALNYTPSAVSQQLASLQRETGLRLFERVGRGIVPTTAGRILAAETETLFEAVSRVESVIGALRAGRVGSLSIGYFTSAGSAWLPTVVAALYSEFPELRLNLWLTELRHTEPPDPDIDIFVEGTDTTRSASVDIHGLIDDPYVAVVRGDHPLAALDEVPLGDLSDERWIDNDVNHGACRRLLLAACAEAGFSPEFAVETYDHRTAIPFVATGIGITVIPQLGTGDLPKGLTTVPIVSPTPVRHISVAIKKSVSDHPAALRTLELLKAAVAGQAPVSRNGASGR